MTYRGNNEADDEETFKTGNVTCSSAAAAGSAHL